MNPSGVSMRFPGDVVAEAARGPAAPENLRTGARAVVVDLQHGWHDDPAGCSGLAAVAARALMDQRLARSPGALAGEHAWRTRHRLERDRSSFSFWSALDDGVDDVAAAFEASPVPDDEGFARLIQAQLRHITALDSSPFQQVSRLLQECAWGSTDRPLGTAQSVGTLKPRDIHGYFKRCRQHGLLSYASDALPGGQTATPAPAPGAHAWQGGALVQPHRARTTRVAVAVPVTACTPGAVELAVEILGSHGLGGRLGAAFRGAQAMAYGLGSFQLSRGESRALAAQAQVSPENVPEAEQLLLETIHGVLDKPVPESERLAAAARVRTALLLQVDQPFGAVDELRRAALGESTLVETAAAVGRRAADGTLPTPLPERPAVAVVGRAPSGSGDAREGVRS